MAELGAVSAIIALVGAGTKVSIALFDLASAVGAAGKELQYIATEVSLFCSVLKELQSTLEDADSYSLTPAAISLARRIADECQAVISEIEGTVNSLRKAQGPSDFPSVDWIDKVKWTFKRSKIQVQRQTLESCKSTLHLFLATTKWGRRQSERKVVTAETIAEDQEDQRMAQGLVMAQQFSISQLTHLEDAESRDDSRGELSSATKDRGRMPRLLEGLSLRSSSPSPRRIKEARASIWLEELVFGAESKYDPHPGVRQKRLSSAGSASEPLHLLQRWTDHHKQRPYANGSVDTTLWDNSTFSFSSGEEAPSDHSTPKPGNIAKAPTMHISPKSTMLPTFPAASTPKNPVSAGILLPTIAESSETDDPNLPYDQWMLMAFDNFGLKFESHLYELAIVYGGQVRVLQPSEKPHVVFDQLLQIGVQPQYVLRRTEPSAAPVAKRIFLERLHEEPAAEDAQVSAANGAHR